MDPTLYIKAIIELGFPVAVAVYLLYNQSNQIESFRRKLNDVELGLYLILQKLDCKEEFDAQRHSQQSSGRRDRNDRA